MLKKCKNPDIFAIFVSTLLSIFFLVFSWFFNNYLIERQLFKDLQSKDWRIRLKSAINLSEKIGDKHITAIIPLLKDESPFIRSAVCRLLRGMGNHVTKPLIDALKDKDELLRANAAAILGQIRDKQSYRELINLLDDRRLSVLKNTIHALGEYKDTDARKYFLKYLKHPDQDIIKESCKALGKLHDDETIRILIDDLKTDDFVLRYNLIKILQEIGEPAAPYAVQLLNDKNSQIRESAVLILNCINTYDSLKALIRAVNDSDDSVRSSAAYGLGEIGNDEAVTALISILNDRDEFVRQSAVEVLGEVKNPLALYPLISRLNDTNKDVRYHTYLALADLKDTAAVPYLIESLKKENRMMKTTIMDILAYLKDQRAGEPIFKIMNNDKAWIKSGGPLDAISDDLLWVLKKYAVEALGKLQYKPAIIPLINDLKDEKCNYQSSVMTALINIGLPASEFLIKNLENKSSSFIINVIDILGQIKNEKSVPYIAGFLKNKNNMIRIAAAEALGEIRNENAVFPLLEALYDKNYNVAERVIYSLGMIGDKRAVEPLLKVIDNKEYPCEAAEALGWIGDDRAVNRLVVLLNTRSCIHQSIGSLYRIGDKGIDELKKIIHDKSIDDSIRFSIARIFSSSNRPDILTILDKLFDSKDLPAILGAYDYFIRKGIPGSEKYLIDALDYYKDNLGNNDPIYENFVTSGNFKLEAAVYIAVNDPSGTSFRRDNDQYKTIWGSDNISFMILILKITFHLPAYYFSSS